MLFCKVLHPLDRVFTVKNAHAAFPPLVVFSGSTRNFRNTKSTNQMAMKWERIPDESFKYQWSSICTGHSCTLYIGHALSAKANIFI
jgi:hypothetical protein